MNSLLGRQESNLLECLIRLAQIQQESFDRLALQDAVQAAFATTDSAPYSQLKVVSKHLQVKEPRWLIAPDLAHLPAMVCSPEGQWGVLRGIDFKKHWLCDWWDPTTSRWGELSHDDWTNHQFAVFRLSRHIVAGTSPLYRCILDEVRANKWMMIEVFMGSVMINLIALATSLYSMQIYDRVVPTGASQTLIVLTIGVLFAVLFELTAKKVRANLLEDLIELIDKRLARLIYMRFLLIRMDQLPQSVGGLAAQMRGYETIRSFFSSLVSNFLVDASFGVVFLLIILMVAGPLALIPGTFFLLSIAIGLSSQKRIQNLAKKANAAGNQKTGLLVETIEGAETIKSGQGGWRMLSRWLKTSDQARESELQMRNITESAQHLTGVFQQFSYIFLVAFGALLVSKGGLTMGGLVAVSILSGRVLSPVSMVSGLLLQWANVKAAIEGLDALWRLECDHHGQEQPVVVNAFRGEYRFNSVIVNYRDKQALAVPSLIINAGEKVGILGPVGSGKTTFLRLLSGMYKPQKGQIFLDDVDLDHVAKFALADVIGYVGQDGRLFAGTLRDNLVLGMIDPGDESIFEVARKTGLLQTVITKNPRGLQQEIFEGGSGLSGGQRQLVNFTRALLRKPRIWLLDEPTASMDRNLELNIVQALKASVQQNDTLVLVTHKPEMLELCDRVIVISEHQIVLDGPRQVVLERLKIPAALVVSAL
jgi:ATP-binding cassette subfamily C protein LapB